MDDVRDRVDLMDGWYVRRGDGRILSGLGGESLLSGLLDFFGELSSSLGDLFLRIDFLLGEGPSGIVGR